MTTTSITSEKKKRNYEIIKLREQGMSYNNLAKYFNITPQRVVAIVKKSLSTEQGVDNK